MKTTKNDYTTIKLEEQDSWLTLWLDRPDRKNALSEQMIKEIMTVLSVIEGNQSIRGLVLRGTNECFCSGADLKDFKQNFLVENASRQKIINMSKNMATLYKRIFTLPKPVISLVEGAAFAGGFGLVCCSDIAVATQNTKFSVSETKIGLTPAQIAPYIVNRIGPHKAKKIILLGTILNSSEALNYGIIDQLADNKLDLEIHLKKLKQNFNLCSPKATAVTKDILIRHNQIDSSQTIEFLANRFADCLTSEEGKEGLQAFSEKRKPKWALL